ncbi:hypothetical protein T492DRAFT_867159 [Pavlovales sp. CCMP2436]|nr:hypothetical protein T492DRAFT_867159 [Pavlovales sp. CCMP2436]
MIGLQLGSAAHSSFVLSATRFPGVHCALYHPDKLMLCSAPEVASTALFSIIISRSNTTADFHRWAIGAQWPELLETVQDERMVVAGNFSSRQHVATLELTARRQYIARRAGSDHFMSQCYTRFRALCKSQGDQSEEVDGGFPVRFIRRSGTIVKVAGGHKCRLPHGIYDEIQAENGPLWQRVRCLFADDFRLDNHAVCNQGPWLRKHAALAASAI